MQRIFGGLVLFLFFCLAGCSLVPSGSGSDGQGSRPVNGGELKTPQQLAGNTQVNTEPTITETTTLVLYFANSEGNLVPEQREVPKVPGIARKAMEELAKGPQNNDLVPTMPAGTRLLDINIRDGLCTVDFSRELAEKHSGGSSGELLTVYSVVNTLTQFPTVKEVTFLIEGERIKTLAGHMDLSVSVERNPDILQ